MNKKILFIALLGFSVIHPYNHELEKNLLRSNNLAEVNDILNQGINVNAWVDGMTPLVAAICSRNLDKVKLLVRRGASVHLRTPDGNLPLFYATIGKNLPTIHFLLENGANPEALSGSLSSVDVAEIDEEVEIKELLSKYKVENPYKKGSPFRLLYRGISANDTDMVLKAIALGADVNDGVEGILSPINYAIRKNCPNMLKLLYWEGAQLNMPDKDVEDAAYPIMNAVCENSKAMVKFLVNHGAKRKVSNKKGRTPLYWSYIQSKPNNDTYEIVKLLAPLENYQEGCSLEINPEDGSALSLLYEYRQLVKEKDEKEALSNIVGHLAAYAVKHKQNYEGPDKHSFVETVFTPVAEDFQIKHLKHS